MTIAITTDGTTSGFSVLQTAAAGERFDGVAIAAAVVPEPETYALLLAGLTITGAAVRRRRCAR